MAIKKQKGASLIELIIVIALITTVFAYLLVIINFSLKKAYQQESFDRATFLAQGLMDKVRNFRDNTEWFSGGLGSLIENTDYYYENGSFFLGTKAENGFIKAIVFEDIYRDANDNIVDTGGVLDENSKKVRTTVWWEVKGETHQIEFISLFTNWR